MRGVSMMGVATERVLSVGVPAVQTPVGVLAEEVAV